MVLSRLMGTSRRCQSARPSLKFISGHSDFNRWTNSKHSDTVTTATAQLARRPVKICSEEGLGLWRGVYYSVRLRCSW